MDPEIRGRVDRLLETYSVYYDVETCEEGALRLRAVHIGRAHCFWRGQQLMVTFLPFPGLRPNIKAGEHVGDRISPPYDVIGPEYLEELQSHPHNVTRLTLNPDADKRYHGARGTTRVRRGIVGILRTEKYEDGNIIPHEETFSKVKADRLNLLRDMECHLESIFGIYQGLTPELNKKIRDHESLVYRYVDSDGVEHRYNRLSDPEITKEISEQLKDQKMLIADGHHRYETALNYALENPDDEKKQFVLATLVASDDEGLVIWPTHRLVTAGDISERNAIKGISKNLTLAETDRDGMVAGLKDHMMGLAFKSGACYLADYDGGDDPMWTLDTYVAQEKILKGVYKSDEGKAEVAYDAELPSVLKKMDEKQYDLAIILNDPSLEKIWDLSMIGKRMPKKTTFFFPKIWSGFVFYKMF